MALADSNDKFVYQVADRLWHDTSENLLPEYYERFGFGQRTSVNLPGEAAGLVPTKSWQRENGATTEDRYWSVGRWVNMAIGQGDVLVTPVQLAVAYAALQNGGTLMEPHIGLKVRSQGAEVVEELAGEASSGGVAVEVRESHLQAALEGLGGVTEPGGTAAWVFEDSPLDVVGKTGTAESGDGESESIG